MPPWDCNRTGEPGVPDPLSHALLSQEPQARQFWVPNSTPQKQGEEVDSVSPKIKQADIPKVTGQVLDFFLSRAY